MALKHALMAGKNGGRQLVEKIEHVMILGVLAAACTVAVIHGFEKGSSTAMKVVFAMVLVAAVGMEFRAAKNMVVQFYKRHMASALGWCALWIVCALSTLYVSFGTAASNIEQVSALHKTAYNATTDTRGEVDRLSKAIKGEQTNIDRLTGAASFETLINGVKVTTADAAKQMIDRAKAHRYWVATSECKETKGPQTRQFCDDYRAATAAMATAGDSVVRNEELKVAKANLVKLEADYAKAKAEANNTKTVVSDEAPHLFTLAAVTGWDAKTARIADGMQLPLLMQALLSLAAILFAIEMCREMPRPESKLKSWAGRVWNGSPDVEETAPLVPMALSGPGFIPDGKASTTTTNYTIADDGLSKALKEVINSYAARMPNKAA